MNKLLLITILAIGTFSVNAQVLDMLDSDIYQGRVKLVSEFMKRFNGEEKNPYIDSTADNVDKINICKLFDSETILANRVKNEARAFQFADSVLENGAKINYEDPDWYAKVSCVGTFIEKEITFDLFLTVEPRGNNMYKWVISDAEGEIFNLKPSRMSEKIMLLPNEHESNFMRLNSLTSEKDDYITLYSSKENHTNRLTVFNTLVYYGYLNIEYVSDIEYTFLQVPGYSFTIKEFEREFTNSGWLISSWQEMNDHDKNQLLQRLYNGNFDRDRMLLERRPEAIPPPIVPVLLTDEEAIARVESFIFSINKYLSDKSTFDRIEDTVKGRYTFIISGDLCDRLAKINNIKQQESYRLDTFLNCLVKDNSPFNFLSVSNLAPFRDKNLRPEYADGFTLISGDLTASGSNSKVSEKVVFFIFNNQIAGIKPISQCF